MEPSHRPPVIGLTGGIASGKSTVVTILRQLGAEIVDADRIVHEVQCKGQPAWTAIVDHFGVGILTMSGELDRRALAAIVFSDAGARERLNEIVHPIVIREIQRQIADLQARGSASQGIIVDVPLLYEAQMGAMFDQVWVVSVTEETQIARLMARDGLDRASALARIRAQMPLDEKSKLADGVIDNEWGIDHTRAQIETLWKRIRGEIVSDSDHCTDRARS